MKNILVLWLAVLILLAIGFGVWFFFQFPVPLKIGLALPEASFRIRVSMIAGCLVALPALKLPKKV